jgi:DnaK suppressor protein
LGYGGSPRGAIPPRYGEQRTPLRCLAASVPPSPGTVRPETVEVIDSMQKKATAPAPAKTAEKAANKSAATPAAAKKQATAKAAAPVAKKSPPAAKATPAKGTPAGTVTKSMATRPTKEVSKTVATKKADGLATKKPAATAPKPKAKGDRIAFFAKQRELLLEERKSYIVSAEALKAQADSLALEHEPGDVQFDEEGGEGGTANVDREIDLYLSGQARATVVEIDRSLQKIEDGTYGICEHCGDSIPDARLQALPYAALCVSCKSGGLSSRR